MGEELAGTIVDGRYRLESRIASGGLSTVWRATDLDRDGPVALKRERDDVHEPGRVKRYFEQERRWARRFAGGLTPGSLVRFVDQGTDDDSHYVVTELIEGGSLADRVGAAGRSGFDAVASLAGPLCRAIAFLHDDGVAHLDVKPSNVLRRRQGMPAVIDLNSAVPIADGTATVFHHDPFKPPELSPTDVRDEPAGPWSDVYALGALLAFVLSGERPEQTSNAVADWTPLDPWSRGVECPAELATVVSTATEPRPADRYDDAGDLLDSLAPVLDSTDRVAALTTDPGDHRITVRAGDAIGRIDRDRPTPAVVLPDADRYLSPTHATIDWTPTGWVLDDRSLNGTYVERDGHWRYVCSREGIERRLSAGESVPDRRPPERIRLEDDARIAPVSPDYGSVVTFSTGR